jgi:hypothetical protein
MPRHDDRVPDAATRPGPYEVSYQTLRGYDAPPPVLVRGPDRAPVMVAGRRDPIPPR